MDLTGWLLRVAATRPHVFVVAVPGRARVRLRVEAEIGRRDWPVADSPADADLLVVAGHPGPQLAGAVDAAWEQMPAPRARVLVDGTTDVARVLDGAVRDLADVATQRRGPDVAPLAQPGREECPGPGHPEHEGSASVRAEADPDWTAHEPSAASGATVVEPVDPVCHEMTSGRGGVARGTSADHNMPDQGDIQAGHDMPEQRDTQDGHDMHAGHGGHAHGGHGGEMEMPGGIPMADLGEDRDGLMLDALHVPLGPLLPDWPAGLVLRVVLQGDVICEAEAEILDAPVAGSGFWREPADRIAAGEPVTVGEVARRAAAGHLDGLGRLLGVAGWIAPAGRARRLRDALLADEPPARVVSPARELAARIGRSRTLRWLLQGIPAGDDDVAGVVASRIAALNAALDAVVDTSPADVDSAYVLRPTGTGLSGFDPSRLAAVLVGAEFAAARLVVAALDPDPDLLVDPTREGSRHGRG